MEAREYVPNPVLESMIREQDEEASVNKDRVLETLANLAGMVAYATDQIAASDLYPYSTLAAIESEARGALREGEAWHRASVLASKMKAAR